MTKEILNLALSINEDINEIVKSNICSPRTNNKLLFLETRINTLTTLVKDLVTIPALENNPELETKIDALIKESTSKFSKEELEEYFKEPEVDIERLSEIVFYGMRINELVECLEEMEDGSFEVELNEDVYEGKGFSDWYESDKTVASITSDIATIHIVSVGEFECEYTEPNQMSSVETISKFNNISDLMECMKNHKEDLEFDYDLEDNENIVFNSRKTWSIYVELQGATNLAEIGHLYSGVEGVTIIDMIELVNESYDNLIEIAKSFKEKLM